MTASTGAERFEVAITKGATLSLDEILDFYKKKISQKKLVLLKNKLLNRAASLSSSVNHGQVEPTLEHQNLGHRRIIEGYIKIIYRVDGEMVYVTDFFDSRMNPSKVKS